MLHVSICTDIILKMLQYVYFVAILAMIYTGVDPASNFRGAIQ